MTTQAAGPFDLLRGRRLYVAAFLFWTFDGLLNFGYKYIDVFTRGQTEPLHVKLIEELTGAWGAGLIVPGIFWLARRTRGLGWQAIPVHLAGLLVASAVHTTWNWGTRVLAFGALGYGHYEYGIMRLRYLMELPNDVIWYALFVVFALLLDHYRAARDREVRLAELETEMAKVRLQALEARLHPHFLFNALNTVSAVMYESVDEADRVLTRLGDFLRRTLRRDPHGEVPLREELATLELYLDILKARFGERLQVTVDVDADARDGAVPPLVLQPLVENAVKHGDPGPDCPARISVRAVRSDGRVRIEVADNGPGLRRSAEDAMAAGIGLSTTRRRLDRLYGGDATLSLSRGALGGLSVHLELPYRRAVAES